MFKIKEDRYATNLIYYYFNGSEEPIKAYKDMANPITMSIATFRKWNKSAHIHVIDISDTTHDWGEYPDILNFTIYRSQHRSQTLNSMQVNAKDKFCFGMLSKPSIIYEHVLKNISHHSTVVVSDADLFYVQNPFPLAVDHTRGICCSLENVGFWYFMNNGRDGAMDDVHRILELWSGFCAGAMIDPFFKQQLSKRCDWNQEIVQEEAVFWYLQKVCPDLLIKDIPYTENFWFDWPTDAYDMSKVKNLHYRVWRKRGKMDRKERGKLCLYIKELRDIVFDVLGEKAIKELYDDWDTDEVFSFHDTAAVNDFLGPW